MTTTTFDPDNKHLPWGYCDQCAEECETPALTRLGNHWICPSCTEIHYKIQEENGMGIDTGTGDAVLSPCGLYRYVLTRQLDKGPGNVNFIMLNPSKADATEDDATIRRCVGFARRWGFHRLTVTNLFAYRSTNPVVLYNLKDTTNFSSDIIGPGNDDFIVRAATNADMVVCAWGNHGALNWRGPKVATMLSERDINLYTLGERTNRGMPPHPVRLGYDVDLKRWRP